MLYPRPLLSDDRILLRPIQLSDLDPYVNMLEDEEGMRLTGTEEKFTREQIIDWISTLNTKEGRVDLAIVPHDVGHLVGEIVLNDISTRHRSANFRIAMDAGRYANRGYGSSAMRLLLPWAFEHLNLHRIELSVYSFNPRARHVYERIGFQVEGVSKESHWLDGQFHDSIQMRLFRSELRL